VAQVPNNSVEGTPSKLGSLPSVAAPYFHVEAVEKPLFSQKFSHKKWRIDSDVPFVFHTSDLSPARSVRPQVFHMP